MTHFDEVLRLAFEAGHNHGYDLARAADGYAVGDVTPFDEWRATLSGLDTREDLGPIAIGDTARVLPSWGAPFEKWYGREGVVRVILSSGYAHVQVGSTTLSVPLEHLKKVR